VKEEEERVERRNERIMEGRGKKEKDGNPCGSWGETRLGGGRYQISKQSAVTLKHFELNSKELNE
jgi:hypothetical protein